MDESEKQYRMKKHAERFVQKAAFNIWGCRNGKECPIKVMEIPLCINSKKRKNRPPNDAYQFLRASAYGEGKGEGSEGRCGGALVTGIRCYLFKNEKT